MGFPRKSVGCNRSKPARRFASGGKIKRIFPRAVGNPRINIVQINIRAFSFKISKAHIVFFKGVFSIKAVTAPALTCNVCYQIGAARGNSDAVFRLDAAVHKAVINPARVNASHSAARINKSNFHKTNLLFLRLLELYIIPKTKSTEF